MVIKMEKLIVSSSPHFNGKKTTQNIMLDVIIALTPAMIASVILFGFRAMVVILTCIASVSYTHLDPRNPSCGK